MVAFLNFTGPDPTDRIPDTPEGKAFLIGLFKLALEPVSDADAYQCWDSSWIDEWLDCIPPDKERTCS